jgi:hypothetical protein
MVTQMLRDSTNKQEAVSSVSSPIDCSLEIPSHRLHEVHWDMSELPGTKHTGDTNKQVGPPSFFWRTHFRV